MRGNRGVLLVGVWMVALVGAASMASSSFPPGVEELLPHAVLLWQWRTLVPFGAPPLQVLTVGDLTGDGLDDVVVSDEQTIFVFAGQPDGSFLARDSGFYQVTWRDGRSYYTVTGAFQPLSAALADLDEDGALDLVVGTSSAQRHEVHLFRNSGRGGLDKVGALEIPYPPYRLWVVDFTGDRVLDILAWTERAEGEGELFLCEGRGGFAFGPPISLARMEGQPLGLIDLDGDGFLESTFYSSEAVRVLWGSPQGFAEESEWPSLFGEINHGRLGTREPSEAVLATSEGLLTGRLGQAGLEVETFYPLGPVTWIYLIDLTDDGVKDALALIKSSWKVLVGKENGGFHPPSSEFLLSGSLYLGSGESMWTMTLAGRPALVAASRPFPTVYGVGYGARGETLVPFSGSYLLAVGDLSGNGAPDLVVEGAVGVDVLWNNGAGGFVRRGLLEREVHALMARVEEGRLYLLNLVPRDRGRAAIELWTVSSRGDLLSQEVMEEFSQDQGNTVQPVVLTADFDGDKKTDILLLQKDAVLVKWEEEWARYPWREGNLGLAVAGQFTRTDLGEVALLSDEGVFYLSFPNRVLEVRRTEFAPEGLPLGISAGDFDGDGYDDLVLLGLEVEVQLGEEEEWVVEVVGPQGWVLLAKGEALELELPELSEGDGPWPLQGLALGDFTGDGVMDIAFTTVQGAGVFVLPGQGDGTFSEALRIPRSIGPLFAAELDGSGPPELIGSSLGFNPYLWIRWNGGGR